MGTWKVNLLHADTPADDGQVIFFPLKSQNSNHHYHIQIHHEKCIQISTNKLSIGPVVLDIAVEILSKMVRFFTFQHIEANVQSIQSLYCNYE